MVETNTRNAARRWYRRWWVRVLGGVLVVVVCFVGYGAWRVAEQVAAVEQCEARGGSVRYDVIYPDWVSWLGIEHWFNEKTFRKIVVLKYASDADLERLENAFDLRYVYTLEPLNVEQCSAEGLRPLSRFPGLVVLSLKGDLITPEVLKETAEMPVLSKLTLDSGQLDDECLSHLAKHRQLTVLGISQCDMGGFKVGNLGRLPLLKYLILYSLDLPDPDLTGLSDSPQLRELALYDVEVSPVGYGEIGRLSALKKLSVYSPHVTAEKLARAVKAQKPPNLAYDHAAESEKEMEEILLDNFKLAGMQADIKVMDEATMYTVEFDVVIEPFPDFYWGFLPDMRISRYPSAESKKLEECSVMFQGDYLTGLEITELPMTPQLRETLVGLKNLEELNLWYCFLSEEDEQHFSTHIPKFETARRPPGWVRGEAGKGY